jgi:FlgD Ig-like domain
LQRVLSTVVLLGLLLASAAAFAVTEHLKLIKSPIYHPDVTKVFSPAVGKAAISFKLRHPDSVTVTIVDSDGNVVDTLATGVSEPKGVLVTFPWDGRTVDGIAPNGSVFRPEVHLADARRTILMPNKIAIDTSTPKVLAASDGAGILVPGAHHGIAIHYTLGEKAHAAVYVRGRRVVLGRRIATDGKVGWNGKAGGKTLPPGRYVLEVAAVDLAGNVTPPGERKRVVVLIRPIALGARPIHVRPGASFTVKVRTSGALHYTWRFAGAHGTAKKKLLRLHAPTHRGRYRLVVSERGHSAAAIVTVGVKE